MTDVDCSDVVKANCPSIVSRAALGRKSPDKLFDKGGGGDSLPFTHLIIKLLKPKSVSDCVVCGVLSLRALFAYRVQEISVGLSVLGNPRAVFIVCFKTVLKLSALACLVIQHRA